jgi:hypothetical protein
MSITLKDLRPGCIVLIAGFDDILEHEFRIEEIYEEFVTGMALSGPFAGEYGEPDKEMIVKLISQNRGNCPSKETVCLQK